MRWHVGDPNGTIIAGNAGVTGAASTTLNAARGITLDKWDNLYVADYNNDRVQLFCYGSTTGITIAGSSTGGSSLSIPRSVQLDAQMNLYVADTGNSQVTKYLKL